MNRQPTDDEAVAELTRLGWSAKRISEQLGITTRTVSRARVRAGVAQPPQYLSADEIATAEAMLSDGASCAEICRTLGRSINGLRGLLRGHGWTPEQTAEYNSMRNRLDLL